ncbi:hypothetical protein QJS04_geneDACA005536 [Acorus gramineus]|uniref:Uncharacterized protein n=1 Tax=Acorus gramineus TaxID=55184 RepID=A0AAV9A6L4_ACOGR|nr:hypothetical protein QJS04_geneDACA005536 [Acorus gramineus]
MKSTPKTKIIYKNNSNRRERKRNLNQGRRWSRVVADGRRWEVAGGRRWSPGTRVVDGGSRVIADDLRGRVRSTGGCGRSPGSQRFGDLGLLFVEKMRRERGVNFCFSV